MNIQHYHYSERDVKTTISPSLILTVVLSALFSTPLRTANRERRVIYRALLKDSTGSLWVKLQFGCLLPFLKSRPLASGQLPVTVILAGGR